MKKKWIIAKYYSGEDYDVTLYKFLERNSDGFLQEAMPDHPVERPELIKKIASLFHETKEGIDDFEIVNLDNITIVKALYGSELLFPLAEADMISFWTALGL